MAGFDLVSLGELLIDFTPVGVSEHGNPVFERNPGGGPANLVCAAQKLGAKTAFVGKVGDDNFGRALKDFIGTFGVDTSGLILSREYKTTLAFVHLDEYGDRSFSFYRKNGADTMLRFEEVDLSILDGCKYFFCSSVLMAEGPSRETSFQMMKAAKEKGAAVYFDPNLRLNLWEREEDARENVLKALPLADIVKASEEEVVFLTGEEDYKKAAHRLFEDYKLKAFLLTLGSKGCYCIFDGRVVEQSAFEVKVVDTTAAGDSFNGGFLAKLLETGKDISACSGEELGQIVRFANAVGGLTTTKKGSICALPTRREVEAALDA